MNAPVLLKLDSSVRPQPLRKDTTLVVGEAGGDVAHEHVRVLVVGGGPAGVRVAQELSKAGCDTVVFNAERWKPYNRVKLTPLLSGDVQIGQVTQSLDFPGPGKVSLYSDASVVDIDRAEKTVTTKRGRVWPYDKLVLCTGSRAHVPNIPGSDKAGVYTFRNFDDVEKLVARAIRSRRCVVVGGGLLGLEAARGMRDRSIQTTVIEHETHLMARQLDGGAGALLAQAVRAMGIEVLTGTSVKAFGGDLRIESVVTSDMQAIACDTVILCTGVRANIALARDVGLAVGRAIKVDAHLRTSDPDIYAVGECVEFDGVVHGLVGPGYEQAVSAARHIAGEKGRSAQYGGSTPATKLKLVGVDVFSMGDVEQLDQRRDIRSVCYHDADAGIYRRLVLKRGHLIGAIAIGDWSEIGALQKAVKARTLLLPWQERRFARTGHVRPERAPQSALDWPRAQTVCNCTGVTRGQIGDAIALGAQDLEDVKRDTGASTVCGSCKIHIGEILDAPAPREPAFGWRALALASVFAAVVALVTVLLPVWPTASRIEARGLPDILFLDNVAKQWSGYTLLAISLLAAVLSLRKRVPLLNRLGDYGGWRVVHLVLGAAALVVLFAHTGFRLGDNLNFWLMASFLGLVLAGALAGFATAFEHRIGETAQAAARLRQASFWLHLAAFWPLPLLLAIHILTVYYY